MGGDGEAGRGGRTEVVELLAGRQDGEDGEGGRGGRTMAVTKCVALFRT